MNLKAIISISGQICSGKSYTAKLIQSEFGFPLASFGGYLKYYCEQNNLNSDRQTLQDTGEALVQINPKKFLVDVISHFIGKSDIIILEGVRHKSIFDKVLELTKSRFAIYIEADLETRFDRYSIRNKNSDEVKTYDQFKIADSHVVEGEIESLKPFCDIIIDSTVDYWPNLKDKLENLHLKE
ncbi:MAG TPA: AAA family ATPase [Saprospiraceae bacterium]|nr:AAA family ATPase [Saprospiraceae bacterium]